MGHGSRDPKGLAEFCVLVDTVRAAIPDLPVASGWLEFAGPGMASIQEAISTCVAQGEQRILAIPVLLHHAGHSRADMPSELARAQARYPQLELRSIAYLPACSELLEIVEERVREVDGAPSEEESPTTALLLVGRGSSDPEANADFYRVGRLLWERNQYGLVECCFVSLALPNVPQGIERCVRLGARRVVVVPYFLNTGVLVKRITAQAQAAGAQYPEVEIRIGSHLGVHPQLVELIVQTAQALDSVQPAPTLVAGGVG